MFDRMERDIEQFLCESKGEKTEYDRIVSIYIKYYHMRAKKCKMLFYTGSVIKLGLLGVIPVFQVTGTFTKSPGLLTVLSSGAVFVEGCMVLFRLQEKWILYRNTCNRLLSVQRQYNGTRDREPDSQMLEYIAAVEEIIGDEARQWMEMVRDKKQKKQEQIQSEKEKS